MKLAKGLIGSASLVFALSVFAQNPMTTNAPLTKTEFFGGEVTINTRDGPRTLQVNLAQFRLDGGEQIDMPLPATGMVLIQHRSGDVVFASEQTRFEPTEGEWVTLDLPSALRLSSDDDSVLVDVVVIENLR